MACTRYVDRLSRGIVKLNTRTKAIESYVYIRKVQKSVLCIHVKFLFTIIHKDNYHLYFKIFVFILFFEAISHCVAQVRVILLPQFQPPEQWDYRLVPPHLARFLILEKYLS